MWDWRGLRGRDLGGKRNQRSFHVIPTQVGIYASLYKRNGEGTCLRRRERPLKLAWVPACVGMTFVVR